MRGKFHFWGKHVAIVVLCLTAIQCSPALVSILINDGEATTNTRSVTLHLSAATARPSEGASQYMASESQSFAGASWLAFTSEAVPFTLSSGDGLKRVYVKLRNTMGQESLTRTDTIYLSEMTPQRWMRAVDIDVRSADEGYGIAPTGDGGYVAGGLTIPRLGNGTSEATLVKLSANGAPLAIATFGDPDHNEALNVVRETLDGAIVAAGGIYDSATGNMHMFATKYTKDLDEVWTQQYAMGDLPPASTDTTTTTDTAPVLSTYATDVLVLASGGYIVAGTWGLNPLDATTGSMFLARLDSDGNMVDYRVYSESGVRRLGFGVTETADGSLMLVGQRTKSGASQAFLIKVLASLTNRTTDLNVVWSKAFYGDSATAVVPAPDGGVVYCGFRSVGHNFPNDSFIAHVTLDGAQDNPFGNAFGDIGVDRLTALAQDRDGGYVMSGSTSSYGNGLQSYLLKTDSNGQLVFYQTFGDANSDDAKSIAVAPDGGYVMAGFTETGGGARNGDFFIVKTDSLGRTGVSIQP